MTCQVDRGDILVSGKIIDASYGGIGIMLPEGAEMIQGETRIRISPVFQFQVESSEEITLRAIPVYLRQKSKGHHVGFRIEEIESGELEWKRLCDSLTRSIHADLPPIFGFSKETDPNLAD